MWRVARETIQGSGLEDNTPKKDDTGKGSGQGQGSGSAVGKGLGMSTESKAGREHMFLSVLPQDTFDTPSHVIQVTHPHIPLTPNHHTANSLTLTPP